MRECILFDLDGTLTDPKEGITKSVQYALRHYGIEEKDLDRLIPFIGPPLSESFVKFYGFGEQQAKEAVPVYREYFTDRGWKENRVIPGIPEMLKNLKKDGFRLFVATSKPEVFARQILEHFGLVGYFEEIAGADLEETRCRKGDVIRYLLKREGFGTGKEALKRCVMVGDREHDVLGAGENGMDCVGVLFGYGSKEELMEAGALAAAATVEELEHILREI